MGIFDFPAPLFSFLDNAIVFLPGFVRLLVWSILGGVLSMVFYAFLSPQTKIFELKIALRESQGMLATSDESFAELWGLVVKTLSLSLRHLMLVFIPAIISSLPLVCILTWASSQFGYQFPEPGAQVSMSGLPAPATAEIKLALSGTDSKYAGSASEFAWPGEGQRLSLSDKAGNLLIEIPPPAAIPQIHKRLWWNNFFGNPVGYLPQQSSVNSVSIALPAKEYLPIGPDWLRSWLTLFFIAAMCSAVATKLIFRIH